MSRKEELAESAGGSGLEGRSRQSLAREIQFLRLRVKELEAEQPDLRDLRPDEEIAPSEERFKVIFEYAPDGYYLSDLKGCFLDGNRAAERMIGYNKEEIIGKSYLSLGILPNSQIAKAAALLVKNAMGRPTGPDEFVLRRKDGTRVPVEISTHPVKLNGRTVVLGIARDVSERKQAERELQKLAAVVQNSSELVNLAELDGTMVFLNEAGLEMLGLSRDEVKRTNILEVIPEPLRDKVHREVLPSLLDAGTWEGDLQYLNLKTGGTTDVHATTFTINDSNSGEPLYLANVSLDITERKKAEATLRESEERFRNVFEECPIGMAMADTTSRFFKANAAFCRMLGYGEAELTRLTFKDITHPDHLYLDQENVRMLSAGEIPYYRTEKRYVRKDGGIVWGKLALTMIRTAGGPPPCFLAMIEDITERKRAADALALSERKYRELADSLPSTIFEADLSGRLTFVNKTALEWFGYSETDVAAGMNVLRMVAETDRGRAGESFQRVLGAGEPSSGEYLVRRKDGTSFSALIVARAIVKDGRPAGLQGIVIDVTERKKAEAALRESETTLQAFINALPDPAFIIDRDGVARVVNRAFADRFVTKSDDIVGKVIFDLLSPDLGAQRRTQIQKVFQSREPAHFEDARLDQSYINYVYPIFDAGGDVTRVAVFALDISQRKRVENELQKTTANLREALGSLINVMASTVEARDPYTAGHQKRVSNLARAIATEMALPKEQIEGIRVAGVIHDIGKISIPFEILSKPGKLSSLEQAMIRGHSRIGYEILKDINFPWPVAQIVYQHHERMNGSGYPQKLKGRDILLEARILAVADVMEAMSSHRPYRSALGIEKALEELSRNKGILYDTDAVVACLNLFSSQRFKFEA